MRVLLTGSSGFIASHLRPLMPKDWAVRSYDIKEGRDICNLSTLRQFARGSDLIINLAGEVRVPRSNENPYPYWRTNAYGAACVFRVASEVGAKVIHASTAVAPYGGSHYAASKRAAELAAQAENEVGHGHIVVLRLHNAYGPGQPEDYVVPKFLRLASLGGPLVLHNKGDVGKDYIYGEDVARAILAAAYLPPGRLEVGTGVATTPFELGELAFAVVGKEPRFTLHEDSDRLGETSLRADSEAPRAAVWQWRPQVTLREGLERTWRAMGAEEEEGVGDGTESRNLQPV